MRLIAFVDYDNVRVLSERTALDVDLNVDDLFTRLCLTVREHLASATEIDLRLYGGWVCEKGQYSRNALWMLVALNRHRGLRLGIRMMPQLVISAACQPTDVLVGTVRLRARPVRQKMVDALLTVDVLHLADALYAAFLIVSDDDDFVPCAIAARRMVDTPCYLIRHRLAGDGLNDSILTKSGVALGLLHTTI